MGSRFVVVSDTHIFAPGSEPEDKLYWNRVLQSRSRDIADCLIDTITDLAPDFVVHCGDITGLCDMENFDYACQMLDSLPCPWYAAVGNHDTWNPGIRTAFSSRFGLPEGQCYYRRDLAGLHFIFLDVAYWTSAKGDVSPYLDKELYDSGQILGMGPSLAELQWLEEELPDCSHRPVILVSHAPLGFKDAYPLATLPRGRPVQAPTTSLVDYMGDVLLRDQLRATVSRFPNVRVAFAGHWHISDATRDDGVLFCQTSSLREYPFEIRVAEVRDGRLSVITTGLKNTEFQRLSYVAEWGNSWVAGSPGDREFTVNLR
jgi:3',5'-cyclic AMP phosphodiesterase CpdA